VLHFATHGTIAGEIEGTSEPGLILTPPKEQTEVDDGYLSASEVAALRARQGVRRPVQQRRKSAKAY
jgi:hypothetical protein